MRGSILDCGFGAAAGDTALWGTVGAKRPFASVEDGLAGGGVDQVFVRMGDVGLGLDTEFQQGSRCSSEVTLQ